MVPRFDSASITPLDQSHEDSNKEEHLSLLHTNERKMLVKNHKAAVQVRLR